MARKRIVVLDGYNVIHRVPELEALLSDSLQAARRGLLRICADWISRRKDVWQFVIVFDGDSSVVGGNAESAPGVRSIYTKSGETADERIVEILNDHAHGFQCAVVSDDGYVIRNMRGTNVEVMTVKTFHEMARRKAGGSGSLEGKTGLSEAQEKEITDSLKRVWGTDG